MRTDETARRIAALSLWLAACSASPDQSLGSDGSRGGAGGHPEGAGGTGGAATFDPVDGGVSPLTARILEPPSELEVSLLTISCAGECKDVLAVASGGNPEYTFAWNDGITTAARPICATVDTNFSVVVADTPDLRGEFPYEGQTVTASVGAEVLACPADAGTDANVPCNAVATPIEQLTPDIFGEPTYFSGGGSLPAGRYRITYVDGCMKYDSTWTWTVQGTEQPLLGLLFQFVLIGASTNDVLGLVPGTLAPISINGYANYDDCVTANRALPPLDFDFPGGPLGIWQNDWQPNDNVAGVESPTWQLSRLECP